MKAYTRPSSLAAYQSVATHGGVAAADPHRLIVMLMDGALERIAQARGCMANGATADKNQLISAAIAIIDELRVQPRPEGRRPDRREPRRPLRLHVPPAREGEPRATASETLDEVSHLLGEIRSAWIALPAEARALRPTPR